MFERFPMRAHTLHPATMVDTLSEELKALVVVYLRQSFPGSSEARTLPRARPRPRGMGSATWPPDRRAGGPRRAHSCLLGRGHV